MSQARMEQDYANRYYGKSGRMKQHNLEISPLGTQALKKKSKILREEKIKK